jgi:hypothetical protein
MCNPIVRSIAFAAALTGCGASAGTIAKDATIAVADVECLISTYSTEVNSGVTPAQATVDSIAKCGIAKDATSVLNAKSILAAHRAGLEREGRVFPPDTQK